MRKIEMIIEEDISERLDSYLSKQIDNISRTEIQNLIKDGRVLINGEIKKPKYALRKADNIIINISIAKEEEIVPQDIKLDIVYEDSDIAVINKPIGMVVHPAPGNFHNTLVNALLYKFKSLSDLGGETRPGIVHRLDKDTSGLLVIAKNNVSHEILSRYFKDRDVKREYIALVKGVLKEDKGIIDEPIGRDPRNRKNMAVTDQNSKRAITRYEVLQRFGKYTLIMARLETGRTHQIRVHFAHIKHPIVGDLKYCRKNEFNLSGQLLHSRRIGFVHPRTNEYMEFNTGIPDRFNEIIKKIK